MYFYFDYVEHQCLTVLELPFKSGHTPWYRKDSILCNLLALYGTNQHKVMNVYEWMEKCMVYKIVYK